MSRPFTSDDADDLRQAERDVRNALGELELDFHALLAVSNIFRAATAVRNHMEGNVLAHDQLSWTAFVVLFVLRVWGPQESHQLASEAGITGGTLTGVLKTLEKKGLAHRTEHGSDRRRVVVSATDQGHHGRRSDHAPVQRPRGDRDVRPRRRPARRALTTAPNGTAYGRPHRRALTADRTSDTDIGHRTPEQPGT